MPPRDSATLRVVLVLLALAAVIAGARLLTFDEPLERDITGAAVMGRELREGRALYAEVWDHKPPALHATHALSQLVAGYGRGAIYLLGVVAALATLAGVYAAGVAAGGTLAGLWAGAFWTVVSGDLWLQGNQPNTEAFINACLVWAFALLVRVERGAPGVGRFVAVGALVALASLYKSVNVAAAAALALAWLAWPPPDAGGRRRALVSVAAMAAVGLVVWVLVVGYFAATGRLGASNEPVFANNRFYAGSITANLLKLFTPAVHRAMISTIPIVTFVAVGAVLGLFRGDRRRWVFLLAWAAGTAVAVAAPGKFYPHYSQLWLPLLAVGGGWAAGVLARLAPPRLASLPHLAGFIVIALLVVYQLPLYQLSPDDFSKAKYRTDLFVEERSLARELVTLLTPEESFYEFGAEMGLYFESRRRPVTGRPPDLFVVVDWAAGARNPVLDWAKANYRLAPGDPMRGPFLLYVRPGSALERRMDAAPTRPGR
ncbi:MAG: hypothetical protein HYU26_07660 [Candidatus Rokubacteria bacterium]|nr:hypothetical protein [Candidatus Rokubacteria bacterium]